MIFLLCFFCGRVCEALTYQGDKDYIYLTFDDGFSLKNTRSIFSFCEDNAIPATFFLHGEFLESCPIMVNEIDKSNYCQVGCHTYNHKDIRKLSYLELINDIEKFEKKYSEATNNTIPKLFRPPMGFISTREEKIINNLGYKVFLWNVSYYDYNYSDDKGVSYVLNNLKQQTKPGSIILMHTMLDSNIKALPLFKDYCIEKGYQFGSLSDLL